jgi:[glutamine synthetase] adenylyltransferase / [glutamine synthetase]-adenylyl-L-tyrosine phosphorylase
MEFTERLRELEGVSPVMRDALRRHPEWLEWLRLRVAENRRTESTDAWEQGLAASGSTSDRLAELRTFKFREYVEIAFRDISGLASFEETVARLSRLADLVIQVSLDSAWDEVSAKSPAPVKDRGGFLVIAAGKLGAGELNYSSDVDLIFCRRSSDDEQEAGFYTRLGERLVHLLGQPGPEGFLYRVDMRLRPHGGTGPLVPTIDNLENYYESWGEAWERQALIKARPVCGDQELARRFEQFAGKFVFARQMDDSSLEEIKQVKHRSEREYARPGDRIHVKQGPGGIRDIEFYVQYLQLITGSRDPAMRAPATLAALRQLGQAKALLEGEEVQLAIAYVFLRIVEHRLQLRMLTPQALIPENRGELEALARGLGFGGAGNAAALLATLRAHRMRVRSILERIYLTPGQLRPREREEEFAQLLSERTPRERVREILAGYGFKDIEKAWQNIRLMALGPAGRLLPPGERRAFLEVVYPMLEVLRDSYDPDHALHHLESFAAASGNRVSFLRALASRRSHLARISNLLALSNRSHQILNRHPEYFDSMARGIHLHEGRPCGEMLQELESRLQEAPGGSQALVLRRYRQREMIRVAYRDLAELAGPVEISRELSDLAEACLHAALKLLRTSSDAEVPLPPLWVVAMGKFGSRQMHYSSDLDLLFLYEDPPAEISTEMRTQMQLRQDKRVESLLELLAGVTAEGTAYKIDLRLRPEGTSGLLARSWSSFLDHARRYMQPWERMALVRSRILAAPPSRRRPPDGAPELPGLPTSSDSPGLPAERISAQWEEALNQIVYGFHWDQEAIGAVRHLKRRIETEINKESRIHLDFKSGIGGVADLEFLVQLLQVLHGEKSAAVRVPEACDALAALRDAGALSDQDAADLQSALIFQRRVENHYQLIEEWTSREISRESPVLDRLARSLGFQGTAPGEARRAFIQQWEHTARQVRLLVDKYFYGKSKAATNVTNEVHFKS